VLARWGIRAIVSLIAIAAGIVISIAALSGFSANVTAVVWATLLFWVVHFIVLIIALRIFFRQGQPSLPLAGLLALASTIVSLAIVNAFVSGMSIRGVDTYVIAALIIWFTTAVGDIVAGRMIRTRRRERRD
jgi:hypothetical protein